MTSAEFKKMVDEQEAKGNYLVTHKRNWVALTVHEDDLSEGRDQVLWEDGCCQKQGIFKVKDWKRYTKFVTSAELEANLRKAMGE